MDKRLTRAEIWTDDLELLNKITLAFGAMRQRDALSAIIHTAHDVLVKHKPIDAEQPFKLRRGAAKGVNTKLANRNKRKPAKAETTEITAETRAVEPEHDNPAP